jgi:type IV secretory pathway VirB4 component
MAKDKKQAIKSTQSYLRISEIKSDTLIMDDQSLVGIVAVSSTNFALKSEEEQTALIAGYESFLNTLDFEIQILMQSRKMEISGYLEKLKLIMEQQTNELLRVQTAEYIEFISKLIENASIMNKSFYIIVPYTPTLLAGAKNSGGLFGIFKRNKDVSAQTTEKLKDFQENRNQLDQRLNTVVGSLAALGLKAIPLKTEEIIELIYTSYNMDAGPLIDPQKLADIRVEK